MIPQNALDYGVMYEYFRVIGDNKWTNNPTVYQMFQYDTYMSNEPWKWIKTIIDDGIWNLDLDTTEKFVEVLIPLSKQPTSKEEYDKDINPYLNNDITKKNTNSIWEKMRKILKMKSITYTGYGYSIDFLQDSGLVNLPFSVEVIDPTSYFSVISSSFLVKNEDKSFIPYETYNDIITSGIPLKSYPSLQDQKTYLITNPKTKIKEPYFDLLTWINDLDDSYKIQANALDFVIVGSGMRPDILYPVLDSNELLVNSKNSAVLFLNESGLARLSNGSSNKPIIYYSAKFNNHQNKKAVLTDLQNFTSSNYDATTAYLLNDPNQLNHVIYLRANFLNELQDVIFQITLIIGLIVGLLTLFFIATLLDSIIKQNLVILGICLANGINKIQIISSFFSFALIPSVIADILSYVFGYLLTGPVNGIYDAYWTLNIPQPQLEWWVFIVIPIACFAILFVLNSLVIYVLLRKNALLTMNTSSEFKANFLVRQISILTSKMSAMNSMRLSFSVSNVWRLLILTFAVFAFISIISISVGTINQFQNSLNFTVRNKKYSYAFDLYSPTIGGGYYSPMPFNEIGISQMGQYNNYSSTNAIGGNYDTPSEVKNKYPYGSEYETSLKDPYRENKYFTSLFMPSTNLQNELNQSITFFNNKTFNRLNMDMVIKLSDKKINPWDLANQVVPKSLIALADYYVQKNIQMNYEFFYWLQLANQYSSQPIDEIPAIFLYKNQPITYQTYLPYITQQPFTIDGSDISEEYNPETDKDKWIYIKQFNRKNNKYEWAINESIVLNSALKKLTFKVPVTQLLVLIMTNYDNPLFKHWYWNIYVQNKPELKNLDYMKSYDYRLAIGVVPVENDDETYTYLNSIILQNNDNQVSQTPRVKVMGIKPNSNFVTLYDKSNNDLKPLLSNNKEDDLIPIIINEVVHQKYGFNIGDVLTIKSLNTYDRFNLKNLGLDPGFVSKFKIVGITTSKSEEQFYISQQEANNILGYQDFSEANEETWQGPLQPGKGYIPFNGVFTKQQEPKLALNYAGVYSPSGMSMTLGSWSTNIGYGPGQVIGGELKAIIKKRLKEINQISRINDIVDRNKNNEVVAYTGQTKPLVVDDSKQNAQSIGDVARRIVTVYEQKTPIVSSVSKLDSPYINSLVGSKIDNTILNVETLILTSLIPTIFIIVVLVATVIIVEVRRLIAMLKVQGYSNFTSTLSFMFVYLLVLLFGTAIAIPFTIGILSLLKSIVFTMFNIIISPIAPFWIYLSAIAAILVVFALVFAYILIKTKKLNLASEISIR